MPEGARTAGFPSPANDFVEKSFNLNETLIRHPAATFFLRVDGDARIEEPFRWIRPGDVLVVDRAVTPKPGRLAVVVQDGGLAVRLLPPWSPEVELELWGVVTYVIHACTDERYEGLSA